MLLQDIRCHFIPSMSLSTSLVTLASKLLYLAVKQRPLPQHPQSIIVIKPCCLGDVILATPALAAIKQRYPQAQLDVAVGSWSRAALINNPDLDQLLDSGRVGQGQYGLAEVRALAKRLRPQQYDLAVTLDRSPLVSLVPWWAGIPNRLGLDSFGRGFAHTHRVPVPTVPRHEARIYLDCVAATGITVEVDGVPQFSPLFQPTQADFAALGLGDDSPFVILHPGGGQNPGMTMLDKRWPLPRFARLAERLSQTGFQVYLTGTTDDLSACQTIASEVKGSPPKILAGEINLGQFGALCRQAALFVGGDTGAMHLAVATGCKTVAIFGPSDPRRYGPFARKQQAIALWHEIDIPTGGVGQGKVVNFSWEDGVTFEEVWTACQKLLGGNE